MSNEKKKSATESAEDKKFPLPIYDSKDDIYSKEKEEELDENEDGADRSLAEGLDVPGSELDDKDEKVGEEDEENNYYSVGGDNHNDLEEEKE